MINQNQILLSQILNSLDHPTSNTQLLNQYLIKYYSQIIPMSHQSQVNKLNQLLNILHLNIQHHHIIRMQRRLILQKLASHKYTNIVMFENTLIAYLRQCIHVTNIQKTQPINIPQDPNQKCIKQLLLQDQLQKRKDQQATLLLIKQLQIKQQQEYSNLKIRQKRQQDIEMECPICEQNIKPNHLALLDCKHWFHKNCTFKHFSQCIQDRNFPLKCPECNQQVIYQDIQQYLTYEYKKKYEQYTLQKYLSVNQADLSWCPTIGCEYVFIYDEGMTKFRCPSCLNKYCLKCKQLYHSGSLCKEVENDQKFLKFARGAKYKECSKCRRWIEKSQGCDHIKCKCGRNFCYKCGGNYPKCHCKKNKASQGQGQGLWGILFGNNRKNNVAQNTNQRQSLNSAQNNSSNNKSKSNLNK